MKINHSQLYDYTYEAACFNQTTSFTHMNEIYSLMMEQASFIIEYLVDEPVSEAGVVKTAKKVGASTVSMVKKFIQFLKNMLGRFIEFITTAFTNNEKWIEDHEKDFDSMSYNSLAISMVPYWEGKPLSVVEMIGSKLSRVANEYDLMDQSSSLSEAEIEEGLKKTDHDTFLADYAAGDNVVDGIKNLMRVNHKDGKDAVELRGDDLKSKIKTDFIPFVKNYKKIVEDVKKVFNQHEALLNKIDAAISKRANTEAAKESFLLMNESLFVSEASLSEPLMIALEAEVNSNDNNTNTEEKKEPEKKEETTSKDSTSANTKVEVVKKSERERAEDEDIASTSTGVLKIVRNYNKCLSTVLSACLTVLEERYSVNMNALKAVYKEGNTRHGRKGNTAEEK